MEQYLNDLLEERKQKAAIGDAGVPFFRRYINDILKFNKKEFLIKCLNHPEMPYKDMQYLFLTIPEIWKDFHLEDWMYIIKNVNRPKKYKVHFDKTANFEDIKFLYKWIEVDSIEFYKKCEFINNEDKIILNKIVAHYSYDMFKDEWYMEDFEENYGDIKHIKEMKDRLINQGAKPAKYKDPIKDASPLYDYITA